jgi:glutamyl-tRNA synthetase
MSASSAPHGPSDEGPRYPGTCRNGPPIERPDRAASIRFKTQEGDQIAHTDRRYGAIDQDVYALAGDFILKRADGMWAYQLAVSVDDLEQGITSIVRGADLLGSTPRQILLRTILDRAAPKLRTLHVPLILGPGGARLAKRDGAVAVQDRRDEGKTPEAIIGLLAHSLGQTKDAAPIKARELIDVWDPLKVGKEDRKLNELER